MLDPTVGVTGEHLSACTIGPQYDLYRYGVEDLPAYTYSPGSTYPMEFSKDPAYSYQTDPDSVSVYAEDMEAAFPAVYSSINADNEPGSVIAGIFVDPDDPMIIRVGTGTSYDTAVKGNILFACTDPDQAVQDGKTILLGDYCVQEGDIIDVTSELGGELVTRRAHVKDVVGVKIPSTVTAGPAVAQKDGGAIPFTVATQAGEYTGKKNTTFIATVVGIDKTAKKVTFQVTDTESVTTTSVVTVTAATSGTTTLTAKLGIKLSLGNTLGTLIAGDKITVGDNISVYATATSASKTYFDGLRLTACPVLIGVYKNVTKAKQLEAMPKLQVSKHFEGEFAADTFEFIPYHTWTDVYGEQHTGPAVKLADDIVMTVVQKLARSVKTIEIPFKAQTGDIFLTFRNMVIPGADEDVVEINEVSDITKHFGVIAPQNTIAYGTWRAFLGGAKRLMYAVRTQGDTKEAFLAAVKKTETNRATYSFCPLTNNYEAVKAVVDFNDEMSQPEVKRWRRTIFGIEQQGRYLLADKAIDNSGGGSGSVSAIKATFESFDETPHYTLMQLNPGQEFSFNNIPFGNTFTKVRRGDLIKFTLNGDFYEIAEVLSDTELRLVEGPTTPINPAQPIEVWKGDTADNAVEFLGMMANSFTNRRALLVWTDHGTTVTDGMLEPMANMYLAAEIAGLSGAVLPQASITHTEITTISAAPRIYTKYSQVQLDEIASYGILVIAQDSKDTPCYIRHQLTTDIMHGSLYYEDSCTRNLDNISYAMVDILEKYIGHANVTYSALMAIKVEVTERLNEFMHDSTDDMIGPSLINWDNLRVEQDKVHKDCVNIYVNLYLPLPLNNVRLYEMAYAGEVIL